MIFAFLGIPGTCLTLKSIGDKITQYLSLLVRRVESRAFKTQNPRKVGLKTSVVALFTTLVLFLPLLAYVVHVREPHWTYLECFYFTFITLSTIGFGDYQPSFRNHADYLLIAVAFLGLSSVSGVLCSLNFWLENYGASVRIVQSLKERGQRRRKRNSVTSDPRSDEEGNLEVGSGQSDSGRARNLDGSLPTAQTCSLDPPFPRKQEKRGSSVSLQLGIFRV